MVDPFTLTIQNMQKLGFFKFFLPFLLSSAVFYGLLRKSQIFGVPDKNVAVNGTVALVAALMVWAYPIIAGVDIETQLSTFFAHSIIATLTIAFALMITSMFLPPDIGDQLVKLLGKAGGKYGAAIIVLGLLIGTAILVSSGLINVLIPGWTGGAINISEDIIISAAVIISLGIVIALLIATSGGGKS